MTLQQLRLDFLDETSQVERLTSAAPPVLSSMVQKTDGRHHTYYTLETDPMEPADQVGRNLSATLVSLIGDITAELNFYPPRYPVRRALAEWERTCRRRHRLPSWTDHATGPICSDMLRSMVEGGASLLWASEFAGVSYPRAERLVSAAERFVLLRLVHWEHERNEITLDPDCEMCRTRRTPAFHEDAA